MSNLKFDVTAKLGKKTGDVSVGCKSAPLLAVVKAAEKVEVEGTTVRVAGLRAVRVEGVLTIVGLNMQISRTEIDGWATNIEETTPAKAWPEGTIARLTAKGEASPSARYPGLRVKLGDAWVVSSPSGPVTLAAGADMTADAKAERCFREGKWALVFEPGDRTDQWDFRPGDKVRVLESSTLHRAGDVYTVAAVDPAVGIRSGPDPQARYRRVVLTSDKSGDWHWAYRFELVKD